MTAKPSASSGGFGLLDFVVLLAMAVTACAFAAGLIVNSGVDAIAGAIAGAALFMVMASSHFVITRSLRTASVSGRLDEMEDALVALDTDLQRIDQVEDDVARLDLLNDRVERLDNALADFEGGSDLAGSARFERLSGELERLQERIEVLRSEVETETKAQREEIGAELKSLEELIKAFSRDLAAPSDAAEAPAMVQGFYRAPDSLMRRLQEDVQADEASPPNLGAMADDDVESGDFEPLEEEEPEPEFVVVMTEEVTFDLVADEPAAADLAAENAAALDLMAEEAASFEAVAEEPESFDPDVAERASPDPEEEPTSLELEEQPTSFDFEEEPTSLDFAADEPAPFDLTVEKPAPFERTMDRPAAFDFPEEDFPFDPDLLPVLRKAIEANRIDLYLQPIVTLPERKLHYCDAVARVRTDAGDLVGPDRYRRVAELAGLLPRIDNVMLVKSVQLLRRLGPDSKLKRVLCGLSAPSLLDRDFFPELVEFLEENSALGESLTFQLTQKAIGDLGEGELTSLKTLGKLGFCFSLNQVAHLDVDFGALRDYFFRFVKIDAETLVNGMDRARGPVPAADMVAYLDRFDLKLIVDKVQDEASVDRLLEYGVELAEGDVFAEPKPISAEMYRELEAADAA